MSNYTQTNIYRKQMQELGLNTKQYAELIEMPYEVVKDIIYDKEGDYSMEIKSLLRRNMMNKHQEIEENYEMAKIKAREIKYNDKTDYRKWYEKEYTRELLKNTLHLSSLVEFRRNYNIIINGKTASNWFYTCLTGKVNYDNHEVSREIQDEFIKQLYDILVNGNAEKYKRNEPLEVKVFPTERRPIKNKTYKNKYFKWFRDFDLKQYLKNNNMTQLEFAKELNMAIRTINDLVNKRHYTKRTLQKLYNYMKQHEMTRDYKEIASDYLMRNDEEIEVLDLNDTSLDNSTNELVDNTSHQIELDTDNNEILRKILINRLTEEEKELIRLFGGKIC